MREKYPLLARMRAERERREKELAAPYIAARDSALRVASSERNARAGLERLMRSEFAPEFLRIIAHKMADFAHREIFEALRKQTLISGTTKLELPTAMLMAHDRNSVVARVIDWWKRDCAEKVDFSTPGDAIAVEHHCVKVQVRIPEMRCVELVSDYALEPRRRA